MGASISIPKVNYEDIQYGIDNNTIYLIHTFQINSDPCLISKSLNALEEEQVINQLLRDTNKSSTIIVYGKNTNDDSIIQKYSQLMKLGFTNVYVYPGGLFEWLLLQDIYGSELFPTTKIEKDLLKYKANKKIYNNFLK